MKLSESELEEFILDFICEIDYDLYKDYLIEDSDDPEYTQEQIESLKEFVRIRLDI